MRHFTTISVLLLLPLFLLCGCENDTSNDLGDGGDGGGGDPVGTDQTCIGCHSSRDNLELALAGKVEGSKVLVPNKGDG